MTDLIEANENREEIQIEDVGTTEDGFMKFKCTNTEFSDIIVSIGKVAFSEEDEAILQFDYTVHEGTVAEDKEAEFKQMLGDFILQAIVRGIEKNDLVYGGGVDENRTDDSEQPGV